MDQRQDGTAVIVPVSSLSNGENEEESAAGFLGRSGMQRFAEKFRRAGFLSEEDVLLLTPRKYQQLGIESLGDQLRLTRSIDAEISRRRDLLELERARRESLRDAVSLEPKAQAWLSSQTQRNSKLTSASFARS